MKTILASATALMLAACASTSPDPSGPAAGNAAATRPNPSDETVSEENLLVVDVNYEEGVLDPVCRREKLRPLSRIAVERCYAPDSLDADGYSTAEREILLRDIEMMRDRQITRAQAEQAARQQAIFRRGPAGE